MAGTIVETKNVDLLRKRPDGNYTKHNPTTIASNVKTADNKTVEEKLEDLDTRLQGDLTLRYNEGNVEVFNGTEWVSVGGDPTLSNYFGQYGTFPFAGDQDVTISSNTTWNDTTGYRKVKKLTINAGVTLTITQTPFSIFAEEIEFKSATSAIDISGPSGSETGGYTNVRHPIGGVELGSGKVMGGCGGGVLLIVSKKVSGSGTIRANGGNGFLKAGATNAGSFSEGAFKEEKDTTLATDFSGYAAIGGSSGTKGYLHPIGRILGAGGGSGGKGGGAGRGTGGGSGIGGGGGRSGSGQKDDGKLPNGNITPQILLELALYDCRGGGGGAGSGGNSIAGGGGGGAVSVWARQYTGTLTLQANGGLGANANSGNGAAGVTFQIKV